MTSRADLPRLFASLSVLGTEGEMKGFDVWDRLEGWEQGPVPAPARGIRGGGGSESAAEDRRAEMADARRAAKHWTEFRADLTAMDALVQSINRRMDMACPPEMDEIRNRRTGEFDPETATDMLAAGWCPNCWLAGLGSVPLSPAEGKGLVRRHLDRCRPCGDFRKEHGIDKPKQLVVAHAENRRLKPDEVDKIIAAAKAAVAPKKKGKKGKRRGKVAA